MTFLTLGNIFSTINFHNNRFNFFNQNIGPYNVLIGRCIKKETEQSKKEIIKTSLDNLNSFSKSEIKKIKFMTNKNQINRGYEWIIARLLAKSGLNIFLKQKNPKNHKLISFNEILVEKTDLKKPHIQILNHKNYQNHQNHQNHQNQKIPFISISHSKIDVVVVLSPVKMGIDSEKIALKSNQLINKVFSNEEKALFTKYCNKFGINSEKIILTTLWSLKEATFKLSQSNLIGYIPEISVRKEKNKIVTIIPWKNEEKKKFDNTVFILEENIIAIAF